MTTEMPPVSYVQTNGIRMAVTEQGEGPAVVLCHGFPELAYSWRHQVPALAEAGFRSPTAVPEHLERDLLLGSEIGHGLAADSAAQDRGEDVLGDPRR